jgi:hypothetical protein
VDQVKPLACLLSVSPDVRVHSLQKSRVLPADDSLLLTDAESLGEPS